MRDRTCGAGGAVMHPCITYFAGDGNARGEEIAFVRLIFCNNPDRDRFGALETRGGFEVRTLFATMQRNRAFRAFSGVIGTRRKRGGATVTARGRHRLHKPRKPRSCYVDRRSRAGWLRSVAVAIALSVSVIRRGAIAIAALSVFTIGVH